MQSELEFNCCVEIEAMAARVWDWNIKKSRNITCITQHPAFAQICLNEWVLETAYYQYRSEEPARAKEIKDQHK